MSEIKSISISEIGITITGKTPSSQSPEDFGNEFMFVTPSDNFDSKYIAITDRYLSKTGLEKLKSKTLLSKSILVSCIGSAMGKVLMNKSIAITNQQINSIIPNSEKFDNDYIYYQLKNNYKLLRTAASGSTALPLLNKTDFDLLKLNLHKEKFIQQKIASVLSALDDKIELNNKLNDNLELMAKTIYNYWFVQFDFPDKNGKSYKSSGGKMVYNEVLKREIPEGWESRKLIDVANITMGQSPNGESYNEVQKGMIFFQGSTDFGWRYPENRVYTTAPTRYAIKDDVLLSVRAPIGTMNLAMYDCCIGRGLAALNSKDNFCSFLIYQMNYFKKKFDYLNSVGTTFGSLTKDDLYNLELAYPEKDILQLFESKVSCFDEKIKNNTKQNQQLSSLRDWLLPMLMNGQVDVK